MKKFNLTLSLLIAIICSSTAQQWGLYTLIAPQSKSALLVDTAGTTYHSWTFSTTTGYSSYLLPGGTILRSVSYSGNSLGGGGMTGEVQKVSYDGTVTWDFVYSSSTYCLHHDICPMPNGNVLLISYDVKTASDAVTAGCSTTMSSGIWSEKIIEVNPTTSTIVWEWHLWDHLCQSYNSAKSNYVSSVSDHPELMNINYSTQQDWFHMNGISYNPYLDQIVVSAHNMNELYVIDHSTTTAQAATHTGGNAGKGGDFLFRWGNPASYGQSATADFNVIHDAHWISPECSTYANYIGAFNNKGGTYNSTTGKSCIDLINPPFNGYNYTLTSGVYTPSTYNFRHVYTGSATQDMGNSQQLPNGNHLVCIAQSGKVYEVISTSANSSSTLWSYSASGTLPKAFRYSACYVAGTQPTKPTISESNGVLTSSTTGTSYQWYLNHYKISGATSKTYTPSISGNYEVQVIEPYDCYSEISDKYAFSTTAVNETKTKAVKIYPNPAKDIVSIVNLPETISDFSIDIYDLAGKKIDHYDNSYSFNVYNYDNGIYQVLIKAGTSNFYKTKLIVVK